jgi:7,8-dihydro-6-hydroxymethylpterin-pyrophosphokinase
MILLNIGSNLNSMTGDRFFNIKKTLDLIILESIKITKISSIYETPSYPNEKKPKFAGRYDKNDKYDEIYKHYKYN